ncbi:glycosyltransferase [Flavobacterium frigoris]|uniref:Uncharacterized protein n=1 Tax=Flavobacterium frigoris (strain PS1) TaxID=1086011 RepID=H7FMM4_FLAFP|nr:glycosyltransferase [Flavobacterium frigoris]EIA10236.1 hypothetical protein HJ01_00331 [Flavobacterium frigoris PS1]
MILQFAKSPPPIGGVSIHVRRLMYSLKEEGISTEILDYSKERNLISILKKIFRAKIIHIHLSKKAHRLFFVFFFRILFKKVIVTYHGKYDYKNLFDVLSLKICNVSIVLNSFSFKNALNYKKQNVYQVGAFIPPIEDEIMPLSKEVLYQLEIFKKKYDLVFATNASSYVTDNLGNEIYCGSELINFFSKNKNYGLIFSDSSGTYFDFFRSKNINIPPNVYIINSSHDFINILRNSSAFIRATTMDGDSLSVKEALYYGLPVFATNVVDRPKGVIMFSDFEELEKLFLDFVLDKQVYEVKNSFKEILKIYDNL